MNAGKKGNYWKLGTTQKEQRDNLQSTRRERNRSYSQEPKWKTSQLTGDLV